MTEVRPFNRHDREQLLDLANAHIAAVLPGGSVPAARLLAQLEHPIGEYVIGPWVAGLHTVVAIERGRVVAGAHLRTYRDHESVGPAYRNLGEVVWLVCWPQHAGAGRAVLEAAVEWLRATDVSKIGGDGSLPAPGTYGVPDAWPHVQDLYRQAGFDPSGGQTEIVYAGGLEAFPAPSEPPVFGLELRRVVGGLGVAFEGRLRGELLGCFEVEHRAAGGTNLALSGWADVGNLWVDEAHRRQGIGTWLMASGAAWLRLGGATRLLAYAVEDDEVAAWTAWYGGFGLEPVSRNVRGWVLKV